MYCFNRLVAGVCAFLVVAALSSVPSAASAQDAVGCIDELSDAQVNYRIRKIEKSFNGSKRRARVWHGIWMAFTGLATLDLVPLGVGGAGAVFDKDKPGSERVARGVLGFSGLAGFLQLVITPKPDTWGARRIARKPSSTPEERRTKLRYATNLLRKASKIQELETDIGAHLFGVGLGVTAGTINMRRHFRKSGLARDRNWALVTFFAPLIGNELKVFTRPRQQYFDWEKYRGMACSSVYYDYRDDGPDYDLSISQGGAQVRISF